MCIFALKDVISLSNIFIDQLKNLRSFQKILDNINDKNTPISLHGLSEENIVHISFALNNYLNKQMLIITHDELRAKRIREDFNLFDENVSEYFPSRQIFFYDIDAYSREIANQRIKVLNRVLNNEPVIIVASIESILGKLINKDLFSSSNILIQYGNEINLDEIIKEFIVGGYERVEIIEGKGQFSIRGGIIDFFPSDSDNPYRIELFDNEVDSIRSFDIKTQRSLENLDKVNITKVKEIIIKDEYKSEVIKNIKKDISVSLKNLDKTENESRIEKIQEKFEYYIERLESNLTIENIENLIPYIDYCNYSLLDYLNENCIVMLDEPNRIEENSKTILNNFNEKYSDLFFRGEVLVKQQNIHHDYEYIIEKIKEKTCITTSALLKNNKRFKPNSIINIVTKSTQSFHNKLDLLAEEIKNLKYRGYKVVILCGTVDRGKRLEENLKELNIECTYYDNPFREIKSGQVFIMPGTISRGFEYPDLKFSIISDKEVFGSHKRKRTMQKSKDSVRITSFTDIKVGDYVVHESHGIGKYVGIERLDVQGVKKDYLSVKYSGEDRLYIPVDQIDLIQKFIGGDSTKPKVSKLGSGDWIKTKTKVKKAIEDMAKDLLELYAMRHALKGFKFSPDGHWQKQFEDFFPYEETGDQLKCIEEIKKDMEKERPMDRLLCGDVGYGKTEVALRAAFKAVLDGKQVAILVPTTILAQQHYNTIVERFSEFPVKMEMLSRFRTPARQKNIINDLKTGNLDIIVGTHRILSKDIKFYDLGLLVVDEEQRFGVKHKEKLKQLKQSVDVLTLSATPIPRTLHMSMIGARDMSVIEEPPEERYPIQTYVVEYNEELIRDAIIKELRRNGQVYFVYNRVKGINKMASIIKELVPEARIIVGHGQMSERELEKVMIDFMSGEYDVLVCTTIIETGLDISNVNTMIINDSDKMGLSQLYQLRGRVGRSNRIAFSYFMHEKNKVLTEVAEKRLKAIKEFTEFGSGFKIAMRDLQIRGAGNLLGAEQHGHMSSIGYDLYVKYLEETVKKLKGEDFKEEIDCTIELSIDGFIPDSYINNVEQKIEMYKKISSVENNEEYLDITEELIDRFGDIPIQTDNLLRIAKLKAVCKKIRISNISQKDNFIKIEYFDQNSITPSLINELSKRFGRNMTFDLSKTPALKYKLNKTLQTDLLSEVERVIEKIGSLNV